jgi:phenylacetate-CoA ligase
MMNKEKTEEIVLGNYFNEEIETMPLDKLQALQSERLVEQVKHVYENVAFYRNKMDEAGIKPEDIHGIEDLVEHRVKHDYRNRIQRQRPYAQHDSDCRCALHR